MKPKADKQVRIDKYPLVNAEQHEYLEGLDDTLVGLTYKSSSIHIDLNIDEANQRDTNNSIAIQHNTYALVPPDVCGCLAVCL